MDYLGSRHYPANRLRTYSGCFTKQPAVSRFPVLLFYKATSNIPNARMPGMRERQGELSPKMKEELGQFQTEADRLLHPATHA